MVVSAIWRDSFFGLPVYYVCGFCLKYKRYSARSNSAALDVWRGLCNRCSDLVFWDYDDGDY